MCCCANLCHRHPQEPRPRGKGRPSAPLSEKLFAVMYKVYTGFSARRFTSDVRAAMRQGLIDHAPHFNSTLRYLANDDLTDHLKALIELSASPACFRRDLLRRRLNGFRHHDVQQVVRPQVGQGPFEAGLDKDTSDVRRPDEHRDVRRGDNSRVRRHQATAIPTGADSRDIQDHRGVGRQSLLQQAQPTGDRGSRRRRRTSHSSHTRKAVNTDMGYDRLWADLWHFYSFHQDEFNPHYHKRSNVESTIAMIKMKFGASVKSKTNTAQVNEVLCKVLCHNICV